ncbi:hypothetical protein niasHT_035934 [Heterodera trifolii]|uniref:Uncharacterized protein n=1 Tax=Heterodera trifolii TaxID=157864 RepID=A0ABD2IJL5_9BILA
MWRSLSDKSANVGEVTKVRMSVPQKDYFDHIRTFVTSPTFALLSLRPHSHFCHFAHIRTFVTSPTFALLSLRPHSHFCHFDLAPKKPKCNKIHQILCSTIFGLVSDQNNGYPTFGDLQLWDPTFGDSAYADPTLGDPSTLWDPTFGDPAYADPTLGDPTPNVVLFQNVESTKGCYVISRQFNEDRTLKYEAHLGIVFFLKKYWHCDKNGEKFGENGQKLSNYLDILYEYLYREFVGLPAVKPKFVLKKASKIEQETPFNELILQLVIDAANEWPPNESVDGLMRRIFNQNSDGMFKRAAERVQAEEDSSSSSSEQNGSSSSSSPSSDALGFGLITRNIFN